MPANNQPDNLSAVMTQHMMHYGLNLLGRAVMESSFAEIWNAYAHSISAVNCATAVEVLIKARIAEVDPLLIFERVPPGAIEDVLPILIADGRSVRYTALPSLLKKACNYDIPQIEQYTAFGRLRNRLVHLSVPNIGINAQSLRYAFEVAEPMIGEFWGETVFDYVGNTWNWDARSLTNTLDGLGISYELPENWQPDT